MLNVDIYFSVHDEFLKLTYTTCPGLLFHISGFLFQVIYTSKCITVFCHCNVFNCIQNNNNNNEFAFRSGLWLSIFVSHLKPYYLAIFTLEIKCKTMPLRHMFHNRSLF